MAVEPVFHLASDHGAVVLEPAFRIDGPPEEPAGLQAGLVPDGGDREIGVRGQEPVAKVVMGPALRTCPGRPTAEDELVVEVGGWWHSVAGPAEHRKVPAAGSSTGGERSPEKSQESTKWAVVVEGSAPIGEM